jgi:hypothetical protein
MRAFLIVAFFGLAACGADGEPERPDPNQREPGITVTGSAEFGVVSR